MPGALKAVLPGTDYSSSHTGSLPSYEATSSAMRLQALQDYLEPEGKRISLTAMH